MWWKWSCQRDLMDMQVTGDWLEHVPLEKAVTKVWPCQGTVPGLAVVAALVAAWQQSSSMVPGVTPGPSPLSVGHWDGSSHAGFTLLLRFLRAYKSWRATKWERKTAQRMLLLKMRIIEQSKEEQVDDSVWWRQGVYLSIGLLGKEEGFFRPTLLFSHCVPVAAAVSLLNQPALPSSFLIKYILPSTFKITSFPGILMVRCEGFFFKSHSVFTHDLRSDEEKRSAFTERQQ